MRRTLNFVLVAAVWVGLLLICVAGTTSNLAGYATCFVAGVGTGRITRAINDFLED